MTLTRDKQNYFKVCGLDGDLVAPLLILICDESFEIELISECDGCYLFTTELACDIRAGSYGYEIQANGTSVKTGKVRIQ